MEVVVNDAIKTAIALVGTQRKLGVECGLSQQAVNKWLHNKAKVSPEYVHLIIRATKGMVKGYQIRPDLPELLPHPEQTV